MQRILRRYLAQPPLHRFDNITQVFVLINLNIFIALHVADRSRRTDLCSERTLEDVVILKAISTVK